VGDGDAGEREKVSADIELRANKRERAIDAIYAVIGTVVFERALEKSAQVGGRTAIQEGTLNAPLEAGILGTVSEVWDKIEVALRHLGAPIRLERDRGCARLALAQVNAGREAARRAAKRLKPALAVGFLSGQEVTRLAEARRLLGADLCNSEMVVSSEHSPDLAEGLSMGRLDAAFKRAEPDRQDLEYIPVARERFLVVMPSDHRLTAFESVDVRELAGEVFISGSNIASVMRKAIEDYLAANALEIEPAHRIHNLTMAMSLGRIDPRRGAAAGLCGEPPALVGYEPPAQEGASHHRPRRRLQPLHTSPALALFLSRVERLKK